LPNKPTNTCDFLKLAKDEILHILLSHKFKFLSKPYFLNSYHNKFMKKQIIYFFIFLISLTTLQGQIVQERLPGGEEISNRKTSFNLEEIKVRWKKAALENCPGVPCATTGPTGPGGGGSFTCGTSTVADIDGNSYNTVSIGTQCWTESNLKVTKYNDGTDIPLDASGGSNGNGAGETWSTRITGARTVYEHDNNNLNVYGYLYNHYAVKDSRKICPSGWHVPSDSEWNTLIIAIDPTGNTNTGKQSLIAGGKMKSTTLWKSPNTGADNSSGFSALPSGRRQQTGFFTKKGDRTVFWSTTSYPGSSSFISTREIEYNFSWVDWDYAYSAEGIPIRCLKD